MKKKIGSIAFIAILFLISCTDDNEMLNNEMEKDTPETLVDGMESYLTVSNLDSINVGDTICNFSEIEVDENLREKRTKSYSDNSGLDPFIDFPLNIVVRESSGSARYLTHQGLNKEVMLKNYDSKNTLFHIFYLKRVPLTGELYIETNVLKGILPIRFERKLLSAGSYASDPNTRVLYVKDGTSLSGARWDFSQSQRKLDGSGAYIFYNSDLYGGGSSFWDFYNLCLQSEGTKMRFGKYVERGTQEFEIRPIEEFDMVSLELIVDNSAFAVKKPDFYVTWDYNNNSDKDQEMSTNFSKKASRTSSFSRKHSVSLTVASTLSVGGTFFVNGQITTTVATTNEWTYGKSETFEDTRTYNFPLTIGARTSVHATLYVAQYEMNVKYRAVFRGKTTGKYFTEIGDWKGVDCTDIKVDVQSTDSYGNKKVTTYNSVPKSRVKP